MAEKKEEVLNRKDVVSRLAEAHEMPKAHAERIVETLLYDIIGAELGKGNRVHLSRFGTFSVGHRAARAGRNPKTGEAIKIPASKSVKFKAYQPLKEQVS